MIRLFFRGVCLHERCEEPQYVLENLLHGVSCTILEGYLMAGWQGIHKIIFHCRNCPGIVHPDTAFKMKLETAEIQVGSSNRSNPVIGNKGFGMIETRSIFIYLYPCLNELPVIRP